MKCQHQRSAGIIGSMDGDGPVRCTNDATWDGFCPEHGGLAPPTPDLMRLLGEVTGWGDQSLSVHVGYKRARVWDAQDDSHLDNGSWGYVVSVKPICSDQDVVAQGRELNEALFALAETVVKHREETRDRHARDAAATRAKLESFKGTLKAAQQRAREALVRRNGG